MWELIERLWNKIKHFFRKLLSLVKHLFGYLKARYNELRGRHPKVEPVLLKKEIEDKLKAGNFATTSFCALENPEATGAIVQVFYDRSIGEIIQEEDDDVKIVEFEQLDAQTRAAFSGKEMLVLS